jgi:DNA-binding response OmpR family regulator
MLPGRSSIEPARKIGKSDSEIPRIFLSAKDQVHHRIEGLEAGANDYITKPFSIREVLLRLEVHLRSQPKKLAEDDFARNRSFYLEKDRPTIGFIRQYTIVQPERICHFGFAGF